MPGSRRPRGPVAAKAAHTVAAGMAGINAAVLVSTARPNSSPDKPNSRTG